MIANDDGRSKSTKQRRETFVSPITAEKIPIVYGYSQSKQGLGVLEIFDKIIDDSVERQFNVVSMYIYMKSS